MARLTDAQARKILSLTSVDAVEEFLTDIGVNTSDGWRWLPLGGRDNNAGSVNLAIEPGQALVERITNALDAHIELQYEQRGRPKGLDSPRTAVAHLWDLEAERLTRETQAGNHFIQTMAPKTTVRAIGSTRRPQSTVVIEDMGIGQHPSDFENTVLSLGESNKVSKPHLMGAFGQGGSSTFAFCPYSLIISRRHPAHSDGKPDLFGWTVVRKFDHDSLKVFRYEYLCETDESVPTLDPNSLNGIGAEFPFGTKFIHYGYDLGRINSDWSLVGYRYFDNLLFDPVLPYRIEDLRGKNPFIRNMLGARNRLDQVNRARRPEAQNYETDLARWGGEGHVKIRYWFFKPSGNLSIDASGEASTRLDSYLDYNRSPRSIVFTLNGQRHHTRDKTLIRNQRLGALADYLLMQVECDGLGRRLKKEIFPATRAGATSGEQREELLLKAIRDALKDQWLKAKMQDVIRGRQELITTESTKRVRRMLDGLITQYRSKKSEGGRRGSLTGGSNNFSDVKRRTQDPPTILRFVDNRPFELHAGEASTIYLRTDGPDDIFHRARRRAKIRCESNGKVSVSVRNMSRGRIPLSVAVPADTVPGYRTEIKATLELEPATFLIAERKMRVVPPLPPYEGVDPPTKFEFASTSALSIEVGAISRSQIVSDAKNEILNRAINPASVSASCDIGNVGISMRGPVDGVFTAELEVGENAAPNTEGTITARLLMQDGTTLVTSKPCKIVHRRKRGDKGGTTDGKIPSYEIVRVWQFPPDTQQNATTWGHLPGGWDENKIGRWEPNDDTLYLYVNMDERQFRDERRRLNRGQSGTDYVDRLTDRYVAYVAFHLYQLHDQSNTNDDRSNSESEIEEPFAEFESLMRDPDSDMVNLELRRVSATLIHTLRSETDIQRLETEALTVG